MTQRHRYIVPIVDRHTGAEGQRTIEAVSAADAESQMASDPTVFVGTARRADGTPEPLSAYERLEHMGLGSPAESDPEPDPEPQPTPAPAGDQRGPYDRSPDADLADILAVVKLQSDRTAWIQSFLVWTVYGIPLALIGTLAGLSFLGNLGRVDASSPVFVLTAVIAVICFSSLAVLLQSIYPTFAPAKKPFRPIQPSDEDLDQLRRRIIESRRARRASKHAR